MVRERHTKVPGNRALLRLATEKHWPLKIADPVGTFELAKEVAHEMLNREQFTRSAVAIDYGNAPDHLNLSNWRKTTAPLCLIGP